MEVAYFRYERFGPLRLELAVNRSALQIVIVSFIVAGSQVWAADGGRAMENVEPAICELGLKIPLLVSHDELRTAQKFMARFVAGLLGGKYGHFEKFERVSGVDGNLHIYMLYTSDGRQIHTVAVLNGQTGEVIELVGPDGTKGTGVLTWRPNLD